MTALTQPIRIVFNTNEPGYKAKTWLAYIAVFTLMAFHLLCTLMHRKIQKIIYTAQVAQRVLAQRAQLSRLHQVETVSAYII